MPEIVKSKQAQFKIHYSGPLVRAQKMDEVASMERFAGQIGAASKIFPTVLNVFDPIQWAREMAEREGIPAKLLRSNAEVEALTKKQQAAMAQAANSQLQQAQGQAQQAQAQGQQAQAQVQPGGTP